MANKTENDALESPFSKTVNIFEMGWRVIEKSRPKHETNEHVYAIGCRQEVGGDVISRQNIKTIEGYVVINL